MVENPYSLGFEELEAMKDVTEFVTLECIGNPVGGDSIGNALWEGVSLKKIIERASPKQGIVKTVFYADDGTVTAFRMHCRFPETVFLAFKMNGKPLPKEAWLSFKGDSAGNFRNEECEVAVEDRAC